MVLHEQYSRSHYLRRLIAYRSVKDYPLIITVGLATDEIFALIIENQLTGFLAAAILSLLILIVTAFSVRGHVLRDAAKKRLERANMLLNATLANMPHGVCMFGADKRLVLANELYSTMYGLDAKAVTPGTTLPKTFELRVASGMLPGRRTEVHYGPHG